MRFLGIAGTMIAMSICVCKWNDCDCEKWRICVIGLDIRWVGGASIEVHGEHDKITSNHRKQLPATIIMTLRFNVPRELAGMASVSKQGLSLFFLDYNKCNKLVYESTLTTSSLVCWRGRCAEIENRNQVDVAAIDVVCVCVCRRVGVRATAHRSSELVQRFRFRRERLLPCVGRCCLNCVLMNQFGCSCNKNNNNNNCTNNNTI